MKKQLLIFSILVVIISIFVSCSTNSSSEVLSTTAVTDSNGITHYYEPVTDLSKETATDKKGDVVTTEITVKNTTTTSHTSLSSQNNADNDIEFKSVEKSTTSASITRNEKTSTITRSDAGTQKSNTSSQNNSTTSKLTTNIATNKQTQPATDKDGWINKWY